MENTALLLSFDDQMRHVRLVSGDLVVPRTVCDEFRPRSSSSAFRSIRLASCLDGPFSPCLSSGHVESALRTPPIHLLSVAEVALRGHPVSCRRVTRPGFSSGSPPISSLKPIFLLTRLRLLLLLRFSGSSPPMLAHQHFLRTDNVQLAPGSSY
ncbi:hypothetical protein CRENBAI_013980 [Crenichthys baileyi]|uniref:Uncharacterized protein n=1 Tax=Crenichthys baileyi TaxID=28760 RepID=A0AAV9RFA7_9TELE